MRRPQRAPVQAFGSGHVEIRFVDRCHFDERRKVTEHFVHLGGIFAIPLRVSIDEDCLRTEFGSRSQRHGGVHTELPGRVRGRRNHAAFIALTAHYYGLPSQRRDRTVLRQIRRRRPYRRERWCVGRKRSSQLGMPCSSVPRQSKGRQGDELSSTQTGPWLRRNRTASARKAAASAKPTHKPGLLRNIPISENVTQCMCIPSWPG